jgi:hypothetical protein
VGTMATPWARSPPCWTWAQYQQQTAACSAELSCFQTADRELAYAFAAFATELRRIEFPAAAQAEAAELGDLADRIAGSLQEQAAAGSPEEYQRAGRQQPGTRQRLRPAGTNPGQLVIRLSPSPARCEHHLS